MCKKIVKEKRVLQEMCKISVEEEEHECGETNCFTTKKIALWETEKCNEYSK